MKPEKIETDQQGVANPFLSPQSIGVPDRESAVTRRRFFLRLAMIGALMGASIPIGVIGSGMAWEVLTGATYQGQLYHEDGPEAFFILFGGLMLVSAFVFAVVGATIGLIAAKLVDGLLR